MNNPRVAAVLTWVYSAGLFETFGGPWSARLQQRTFIVLLMAFLIVTLAAAWAAWLLWNGSKAGAVIALVLLPIEAVFWVGFALPIPWLIGVARVAYVALAWKGLG